jgi:ribulose-bisphosphate carboxylase large chain
MAPVAKAGKARSRRQSARPKEAASEKSEYAETDALRRCVGDFRWDKVELEPYKISAHKGGEFCGASRQVLIGRNHEPVKFHLRYFELEPGGFTSLERHRHSHVVVAMRGRGRVRIEENAYAVKPFDLIYIGPNQAHQLTASGRAPFGFFCIVDAKRDKPRPV